MNTFAILVSECAHETIANTAAEVISKSHSSVFLGGLIGREASTPAGQAFVGVLRFRRPTVGQRRMCCCATVRSREAANESELGQVIDREPTIEAKSGTRRLMTASFARLPTLREMPWASSR